MPKPKPGANKMSKKLYSLSLNDQEIVSVEMDVPDFMPRTPVLNRQWLKGVVTEEVANAKPASRRAVRPGKSLKVSA